MASLVPRDRRSSDRQPARGDLGAARPRAHAADTDSDGVDVQDLVRTLGTHRRKIVLIGTVVFALVMVATLFARMEFKSSGRLYLGDLEYRQRQGNGQQNEIDLSGNSQGDVGSEIEILKSQSLIKQTVLESGLNVTAVPDGWKPPRFWQWWLARRRPGIIDAPAKTLLASDAQLTDTSIAQRNYTARFQNGHEYDLCTMNGTVIGHGQLSIPLKTPEVTLTLSPGLSSGPAEGSVYELEVRSIDATIDAVSKSISVMAAKGAQQDTKVVTLEFSNGSPLMAATFLRKLMNGYLGERQAWKTQDASAAESFVTDQLRSLRDSVEQTEQKLADYRSNTRAVVLGNEAKGMIEQVGKYEEQRVTARLQVAALNNIKRALKEPNLQTEAFLIGEAKDTVLEGMAKKITEARNLSTDADAQYGPNSPQAQKARAAVDAQLSMIRNYVDSRLHRAQESLGSLGGIIGQYENKLKSVPGAELGLAQIKRESEVYNKVYSSMLERQQQAAIVKASTVSHNRILDYPHVPHREDAPLLGARVASAPLGFLLGAVIVLLHRMFASALQSSSDIRKLIGSVPVYGSVPQRKREKALDAESEAVPMGLSAIGPSNSYAEAFRTIRTNLYHWGRNEAGRVVLFSSPNPGDGKTTCVLSLAAILAADRKRVLVVDADLRKPMHEDDNPVNNIGLRGVLAGQCDWTTVVQGVQLSVGKYDAIAAGKMAPAELLSSERMTRFLQEARTRYDFILLDSPSFPLVSDALVLANVSDFVLSVIRVRNSGRNMTMEHMRRLASAAQTYGVVINDSHAISTSYPEKQRDPMAARMFSIFAPFRRRLKFRAIGHVWMGACAAIIVLAAIVMLIQQFSPIEGGAPGKPEQTN